MVDVALDLSDWEAHRRKLERFAQREQQIIVREAAELAGAAFDEVVRSELPPPRRPMRQAPFWTAKQRRWWWGTMHAKAQGSKALPGWKAAYKIRDGRKMLVISGFYRRTGTLVKSLTYEVRQRWPDTDVVYGTNRAYARYVIDQRDQARYHKGNWKTLQQFATDGAVRVRRAFEVGIERGISRRLGG